jgi:hypothetical protein
MWWGVWSPRDLVNNLHFPGINKKEEIEIIIGIPTKIL